MLTANTTSHLHADAWNKIYRNKKFTVKKINFLGVAVYGLKNKKHKK